MIEHIKNIEYLYGDAGVQIPNAIFRDLSYNIKGKNGKTNVQQVAFAYTYVVVIAFLYKYAHFVDIDNNSYIQNADIKELLGYNRITKSIDHVIKKNGVLDEIGLTKTIKDYPIQYSIDTDEKINNIPIREFTTISDINSNGAYYKQIKGIVKNRNYETKEPVFLFEYKEDTGTLYNYANTHKITIKELVRFISDKNFDNIDFLLYSFFKSKCYNMPNDMKAIPLRIITSELGIGKDAFYSHIDVLKANDFIRVEHKVWSFTGEYESNNYYFKCIKGDVR